MDSTNVLIASVKSAQNAGEWMEEWLCSKVHELVQVGSLKYNTTASPTLKVPSIFSVALAISTPELTSSTRWMTKSRAISFAEHVDVRVVSLFGAVSRSPRSFS